MFNHLTPFNSKYIDSGSPTVLVVQIGTKMYRYEITFGDCAFDLDFEIRKVLMKTLDKADKSFWTVSHLWIVLCIDRTDMCADSRSRIFFNKGAAVKIQGYFFVKLYFLTHLNTPI